MVEVSDFTLAYDRRAKAELCARAGIEDYWIVNLVDRVLEVRRSPIADAEHPFAHRYDQLTVLEATQRIAPLARPQDPVAVADVLP